MPEPNPAATRASSAPAAAAGDRGSAAPARGQGSCRRWASGLAQVAGLALASPLECAHTCEDRLQRVASLYGDHRSEGSPRRFWTLARCLPCYKPRGPWTPATRARRLPLMGYNSQRRCSIRDRAAGRRPRTRRFPTIELVAAITCLVAVGHGQERGRQRRRRKGCAVGDLSIGVVATL